jgi:thiol-disulfide isomerase/thioredoxin
MSQKSVFLKGIRLFALILLVLAALELSDAATQQTGEILDLVLLDLDGKETRLAAVTDGRASLLYFWATWCKPCRKLRPKVSTFAREFRDQIRVLGINVGGMDSRQVLEKYRSRHRITYPLLLDYNDRAVKEYRIFTIPTFFLLTSNGEILYRGNNLPQHPKELLSSGKP